MSDRTSRPTIHADTKKLLDKRYGRSLADDPQAEILWCFAHQRQTFEPMNSVGVKKGTPLSERVCGYHSAMGKGVDDCDIGDAVVLRAAEGGTDT